MGQRSLGRDDAFERCWILLLLLLLGWPRDKGLPKVHRVSTSRLVGVAVVAVVVLLLLGWPRDKGLPDVHRVSISRLVGPSQLGGVVEGR